MSGEDLERRYTDVYRRAFELACDTAEDLWRTVRLLRWVSAALLVAAILGWAR